MSVEGIIQLREEYERVKAELERVTEIQARTFEALQRVTKERDLLMKEPGNRLDAYREQAENLMRMEDQRDAARAEVAKLQAACVELARSSAGIDAEARRRTVQEETREACIKALEKYGGSLAADLLRDLVLR